MLSTALAMKIVSFFPATVLKSMVIMFQLSYNYFFVYHSIKAFEFVRYVRFTHDSVVWSNTPLDFYTALQHVMSFWHVC